MTTITNIEEAKAYAKKRLGNIAAKFIAVGVDGSLYVNGTVESVEQSTKDYFIVKGEISEQKSQAEKPKKNSIKK